MACALLFSNLAPSAPAKAWLFSIHDASHKFGYGERMKEWLARGNPKELWKRSFTIVYITDRTVDQMSYLLDEDENENRLYSFVIPPDTSADNIELYETGEMWREFSQVEKYIKANAV